MYMGRHHLVQFHCTIIVVHSMQPIADSRIGPIVLAQSYDIPLQITNESKGLFYTTMSLSIAGLSSETTDGKEDEPLNMFFTTSHLLNTMNSALDKLTTDQDDVSPRFELQKRLPDGSTVKADARDMAVADMESKFTQAAKEVEDLSPSQRLEWAELQRQAGNKFYRKKEYEEAIDVYLTCLVVKSETPEFLEDVFLPVMNNLAQCTLQMGSYKKAQTFCTMALEEKNLPNRPEMISKLYFRRGKARRLSGDYLGCKEDLKKAIELLPQHLVAEHRSIEKESHTTYSESSCSNARGN